MATFLENLASKTWESPRSHEETEATNKRSFWPILGVVSIADHYLLT